MSIIYTKNVPLSTISTFRMGGVAKEIVMLENEDDVVEFFDTLPVDKKWFVFNMSHSGRRRKQGAKVDIGWQFNRIYRGVDRMSVKTACGF